jgi:surfeit locus 1 family protein
MRAEVSPEIDTSMSHSQRLLFALTVVVSLLCAGLGSWQLGRLIHRRAMNRAALAERDLPVVDLNQQSLSGPVHYRRVTISGELDFDREILLRGHLLRGAPGIEVVTPIRASGRDTAVLVNRGFVPTPDAGAIRDPTRYGESASATMAGIATAIPDSRDGHPLTTERGETWRRLDLTALRGRLPYPIAAYYVIAEARDTGEHSLRGHSLPIRIEPPGLDDGPHLSYAIQWFLIGAAALGFGILFVRKSGRRRV